MKLKHFCCLKDAFILRHNSTNLFKLEKNGGTPLLAVVNRGGNGFIVK